MSDSPGPGLNRLDPAGVSRRMAGVSEDVSVFGELRERGTQ